MQPACKFRYFNHKCVLTMFRVGQVLRVIRGQRAVRTFCSSGDLLKVSNEVKHALETGGPVVALESTIITHGMPYPDNVACALNVENNIRAQGAIPATIAIINGKIRVGLEEKEIDWLGDTSKTKSIKTSRRDYGYVLSKGLNGGTTVSGTMIAAAKAGIQVFATGGIGGVHREGESTFDISADLTELGRTPVAVVSSGVKSILDIPKTLEFLETQGVFVSVFGDTKSFPAFYSRKSGCEAPYNVFSAAEAASIIHQSHQLGLKSGQVFAVPVPHEFAMEYDELNEVIERALRLAKEKGIYGKETTPFLLAEVAKATKGNSLKTNIELVKNNATVAAKIAVELSKLKKTGLRLNHDKTGFSMEKKTKRPFVIGGSALDTCVTLKDDEIKLDGRVHYVKVTENPGGVARNICEALGKLEVPPAFLSAIGDDVAGQRVYSSLHPNSKDLIHFSKTNGTTQFIVIFDKNGDCKFILGDIDVQKEITPEMIRKNEELIKDTPLLIIDGGLPTNSMNAALELAGKYNTPVFYETTDVPISIKPFETSHWKNVTYISPNLNELLFIANHLKIKIPNTSNKVLLAANIVKDLSEYIENVIVTLGGNGIVIARRHGPEERLLLDKTNKQNSKENLQIRHYPVNKVEGIVNVSGAGDCFASAFITAMLEGQNEQICMSVGFSAAECALKSATTVPKQFFGKEHISWKTPAPFNNITL